MHHFFALISLQKEQLEWKQLSEHSALRTNRCQSIDNHQSTFTPNFRKMTELIIISWFWRARHQNTKKEKQFTYSGHLLWLAAAVDGDTALTATSWDVFNCTDRQLDQKCRHNHTTTFLSLLFIAIKWKLKQSSNQPWFWKTHLEVSNKSETGKWNFSANFDQR